MSKFFTSRGGQGVAWLGVAITLQLMPAAATPDASKPVNQPDSLPLPLGMDRFSPLAKKSPFTLASSNEEVVDFAKDLLLAGYFRMEGKDFVMVANRTRPDRFMVGTEASPTAHGLVLVKVERDPSGDPTKLKAQIRKGTEFATLKYEVASASPANVPPAPGAGPAVPPPVPGAPQASGAAPTPGAVKPPVIRRRVIPIPPAPGR